MSALMQPATERNAVLAKAFLRAAETLGMKQKEAATVLGLSSSRLSQLKSGGELDPNSKPGEAALMLIRIARGLYALNGGSKETMRHFMYTKNRITGGVPIEQVQTLSGLNEVLLFVDSIRGKT